MEGMCITTPYDRRDLIEVTELEEVEFAIEEDVEALLEYGPDQVGFDEVIEGYEVYRRLNSKFRDRDVLNQVNPPKFTVFTEE